jgi:GxxExxY protein
MDIEKVAAEIVDTGFRLDVIVEGAVIIEIKAVEQVAPVHQAQLLTYLKLSKGSLGFLINFNVMHLRDGIKRMVRNCPTTPLRAPSRPSR